MPLVPPVIAGEGRLWALFSQGTGFVLREFAQGGDRALLAGACPTDMVPSVLGMVEGQPALLCVDYARARYAFGLATTSGSGTSGSGTSGSGTRESFAFQKTATLTVASHDRLREISHFVPIADKIAVLYRTYAGTEPLNTDSVASASLGSTTTSSASTGTQLGSGKWWLQTGDGARGAEAICPRPGVSQCGQSPLMLYAAEGQLHVVISNGKASSTYQHLSQLPGKALRTLPMNDVPASGAPLKAPCISGRGSAQAYGKSAATFTAYTPTHNLVGSLLNWQGEHMGVIEQSQATLPQGPDVWASTPTRCPPDVRALGTFPNGTAGATQATTRWVRATRSGDTWLVGYAVPAFSVKQGEVTYSYPESYWVLRRRSHP